MILRCLQHMSDKEQLRDSAWRKRGSGGPWCFLPLPDRRVDRFMLNLFFHTPMKNDQCVADHLSLQFFITVELVDEILAFCSH